MKLPVVGKDSEKRIFSHFADGSIKLDTSILEQSFTKCVKNLKSMKTL